MIAKDFNLMPKILNKVWIRLILKFCIPLMFSRQFLPVYYLKASTTAISLRFYRNIFFLSFAWLNKTNCKYLQKGYTEAFF